MCTWTQLWLRFSHDNDMIQVTWEAACFDCHIHVSVDYASSIKSYSFELSSNGRSMVSLVGVPEELTRNSWFRALLVCLACRIYFYIATHTTVIASPSIPCIGVGCHGNRPAGPDDAHAPRRPRCRHSTRQLPEIRSTNGWVCLSVSAVPYECTYMYVHVHCIILLYLQQKYPFDHSCHLL